MRRFSFPNRRWGPTKDNRSCMWSTTRDEVAYRPVRLGALQDGQRVVEEGLAEGERIVIKGVQRVQQGIKVDAKLEPMPNPNAAATPPLVTNPEGPAGRPSS